MSEFDKRHNEWKVIESEIQQFCPKSSFSYVMCQSESLIEAAGFCLLCQDLCRDVNVAFEKSDLTKVRNLLHDWMHETTAFKVNENIVAIHSKIKTFLEK